MWIAYYCSRCQLSSWFFFWHFKSKIYTSNKKWNDICMLPQCIKVIEILWKNFIGKSCWKNLWFIPCEFFFWGHLIIRCKQTSIQDFKRLRSCRRSRGSHLVDIAFNYYCHICLLTWKWASDHLSQEILIFFEYQKLPPNEILLRSSYISLMKYISWVLNSQI